MKKIIFIIGFIIFSFSLSTAQITGGSGHQYKSETSREKESNLNKLFEKGWYLRPEFSIGFPPKFEFLCGAGYQINQYLYAGIGIGLGSTQKYHEFGLAFNDANFWYTSNIPLFATFRVHILSTKKAFRPFFETKMGYSCGIWGHNYYEYSPYSDSKWRYSQRASGFYGHLGIGISYRNFNILLSYHTLGFEYQEEFIIGNIIVDRPTGSDFRHHFSISVAYSIPLKRNNR